MSADRLLVPVRESTTLRQTVEYAVESVLGTGSGHLRFVYVHSPDLTGSGIDEDERTPEIETAQTLFNRIESWVEEDAGSRESGLTVETAHLGTDRYLFSPDDVASAIAEDAKAHGITRIVFDPEYDPGVGTPLLRPLQAELARLTDIDIEDAPIDRPVRRSPLTFRSTPVQVGVLFGIAFLFYQVLAGTPDPFDLVTGGISATVVTVALSRVTFNRDPGVYSIRRLLRLGVYVPYLVFEILKANIAVAAVILDPRRSIEPRLTRIRPAVWGSLPITTLANSITLTPGTLSVRLDRRTLIVHTLTPSAREDLFDGGLERAVRFVFYGRDAMSIPSLRDRDEADVLQQPDDGADEGSERGDVR